MMYRGRQMAISSWGGGCWTVSRKELKDISKVEQEAKLEGRNMSMVLAPNRGRKCPNSNRTCAPEAGAADRVGRLRRHRRTRVTS